MDSGTDTLHLPTCVDALLAQREARRAFDKAPHTPIAGTSTVAMTNDKLLADFLFLDEIVALRAMAIFSR